MEFCDVVIHLDGVLGLPDMLANIGHGMIIEIFYGESYLFLNEVTGVYIVKIYHHYVVTHLHPS